jgi:7,8-dihydropterin-6-yl-methyl-4-(beta-D-ribofuranosyl)aminobenzene 5'-phosphate synthase
MRITVLLENSSLRSHFKAEHGLSLLIESGNKQILSDTGKSRAFVTNAHALGVDLTCVDALVLSHAHYDHGGGISFFLAVNATAPIYMSTRARGEFYAIGGPKIDGETVGLTDQRYIGLSPTLFADHGDRFIYLEENTEIGKGIHILTDIGRQHPLPPGNDFLFEKRNNRIEADSFRHEVLLVIEEADGMVLFSGCGHGGILNMIDAARRQMPQTPIKAIVGGLHLIEKTDEKEGAPKTDYVETLAQALLEAEVGMIYTGHCTGDAAFKILKRHLNDRVAGLHCGAHFEI